MICKKNDRGARDRRRTGALLGAVALAWTIFGTAQSAQATLYDLHATSLLTELPTILSDFTIRFDDTGDMLLQHSEIQSFSGLTFAQTGFNPPPFTSVSKVGSVPGFATQSGAPGGIAGHWTFGGSSFNLFGDPTWWTYSRTSVGGPPPGSSPGNPLLPISVSPSGFDFAFTPADHTVPTFIDPDIAVGYDYEVSSGPNVASVIVPAALPNGDAAFTLDLGAFGMFPLIAGATFDLLAIDALGFSEFSILDISIDEALDPDDSLAFVTGLTFVSTGEVAITQSPIVESIGATIPEPGSLGLFALGLACFGVLSRRRTHSAGC